MRTLNNKGIALVTALMLTLISLVIILGILFIITQNIRLGAANKRYKNSLEASYGGVDIVTQEIIPKLFTNVSTSVLKSNFASINMSFGSSACIRQKLNNKSSAWTACTEMNLNPKLKPDMTFQLTGNSGMNFNVFTKIVDTVPGVPYQPSPVGGQLLGGGVADSSVGTTMNLSHYVYRVEVAAERVVNPLEKSLLSVLYEY
jgi:hypothetical protein